ncbi:uncharacterized protein ACIBXB_017011 [Morphnus guianensis]
MTPKYKSIMSLLLIQHYAVQLIIRAGNWVQDLWRRPDERCKGLGECFIQMEKPRHTMGTSSGGQQASHMEEGLNLTRLCLLGNTIVPAPTAELLVDAQKIARCFVSELKNVGWTHCWR